MDIDALSRHIPRVLQFDFVLAHGKLRKPGKIVAQRDRLQKPALAAQVDEFWPWPVVLQFNRQHDRFVAIFHHLIKQVALLGFTGHELQGARGAAG